MDLVFFSEEETMRLVRNENPDGVGKYIVVNTKKLDYIPKTPQELAEAIMRNPEAVNFGSDDGTNQSGFFVLMLKDKYTPAALREYSQQAFDDGEETYAKEIRHMVLMAESTTDFKKPD